jgi:predicted nucleotidyltransferase
LQCIADELKKRRALERQNERYMKARNKTVSEDILQEIVRRIVRVAKPEKIILFGSAAREEMGPDSDLDLLVLKPCGHRRRTARKIERSLIGIGIPTDIIVARPADIERYKNTIGLIYRPALREGKIIYAA